MSPAAKVLAAVVVCLVGLSYWEGHQAGVSAARASALEHERDSLRKVSDSLQGAFRRDTVRVFRRIDHTDTLIQHQIDSAIVQHTDTVKVTVEVLKQEQETIRACRETVTECAAGWNLAKQQVSNLERQLKVSEQSKPGIIERWGWRILSFELGRISAGRTP